MLVKFAPNTFRMVIDNSGFSSADDDLAGIYGLGSGKLCGVTIAAESSIRWTDRPDSPLYFSPARRAVRTLLDTGHVGPSGSFVYCYHCCQDTVSPPARKRMLPEIYRGKLHYEQTIVEQGDLDGRLFKTLEHGMKASMRGLFCLSYEKYAGHAAEAEATTDFDMRTEIRLPCAGRDYLLAYSGAGVRLSICPDDGGPAPP